MPGCSRSTRAATALVATLLLSSALLVGCYGGRSNIVSGPQRISETEGRKTRQEREAAEAKAEAAQAAAEQKAAAERAEADRALLEKKIIAEQAAQQKKAAEAKAVAEKAALAKKAADDAKVAQAQTAVDQATLDAKVAEVHAGITGAPSEQKAGATTTVAATKNVVKDAAAKSAPVAVQTAPAASKTTPGAVAVSSLEVAKSSANATSPTPVAATATTAAAATPVATVEGAEKPAKAYVAYVQIASFTSRVYADGAAAWMKAHGYESVRVVDVEQGETTLHRVQAGPYQDPVAAHKALDDLKVNWPQSFIPAD